MLLDGHNPYVSGGPPQIVLTPEDFAFSISEQNLQAVSREADWLVLFYIAADNNLAEQLFENVRQLKAMASSERVHVCVFFDGPWLTDCFFARLNPGGVLSEDLIGRFLDVPSNQPKILTEIIANAIHCFPARRRLLVLSGHGAGWAGLLRDDNGWKTLSRERRFRIPPPGLDEWVGRLTACYKTEILRLNARRQVAGISDPAPRQRLVDVVALDACHMGNIEALQSIAEHAEFIVASEEREADCGYPADRLLQVLLGEPEIEPEALARRIVVLASDAQARRLADAGNLEWSATQAAFVLSHWAEACAAIGRLGAALIDHMLAAGAAATASAVANTYAFPLGCRDIKGFAENLLNADFSAEVQAAATAVIRLFESGNFLIESRVPGGRYLPNGLSIYLPDPPPVDPRYIEIMPNMPDGFAPWIHFVEARALLTRPTAALTPEILNYVKQLSRQLHSAPPQSNAPQPG